MRESVNIYEKLMEWTKMETTGMVDAKFVKVFFVMARTI